MHFLAESTAAATAYGLTVSGTKQVLIFDMGGGTTDLSIMHIQNGTLSVQSTGGNNVLGGKNIDAALLELVESKTNSLNGTHTLLMNETYTFGCNWWLRNYLCFLTDQQKEALHALSRTHLLQLCRQCKVLLLNFGNCFQLNCRILSATNASSHVFYLFLFISVMFLHLFYVGGTVHCGSQHHYHSLSQPHRRHH